MRSNIHKLQCSTHNGNERYHLTIPLSLVHALNWNKGTKLKLSLASYEGDIKIIIGKTK